MKRAMLWIAMGLGAAMFDAGCMASENGADRTSAEVEQAATCDGCGDGTAICNAWTACYRGCRNIACTNPTSCASQTACYTFCDNTYEPAPTFCPFP